MKSLRETRRLLQVVRTLRRKCPWDRKQTHRSLVPYVLEEAYEVADAIERGDDEELREELGDLLLQVALHAELASEKRRFDFEAVSRAIADKMIHRHPHVYRKTVARTADEVKRNWAKLKRSEKPERETLGGIPRALPALQLSQKYGARAATVGFDWPSTKGLLEKLEEEKRELARELRRGRRQRIEMELGDLLFTVANLARHLKIDAESALRKSAGKFRSRFEHMERAASKRKQRLEDLSAQELDALWNAAKRGRRRS